MDSGREYFKGRGSQINPNNKFAQNKYKAEFIEGLDEELLENSSTQFYQETPKK